MTEALPANIGAPATRALANAGITSIDDLLTWDENAVAALHGVGPKVIRLLHQHLDDLGMQWTGNVGARAIDAYLTELSPTQRDALTAVRLTLRAVLPHADECMKYAMPAIALGGKGVAGYAAFQQHWSYFPMSGSVLELAGDAVARYERTTTNAGLKLGFDERLPVSLVRKLVKLRVAELGAVQNGRRSEYYGNGRLKAVGPMRAGNLHGKWQWFRQDGTLWRTGQFANGEQVGTWVTYDRAGQRTKTRKF